MRHVTNLKGKMLPKPLSSSSSRWFLINLLLKAPLFHPREARPVVRICIRESKTKSINVLLIISLDGMCLCQFQIIPLYSVPKFCLQRWVFKFSFVPFLRIPRITFFVENTKCCPMMNPEWSSLLIFIINIHVSNLTDQNMKPFFLILWNTNKTKN